MTIREMELRSGLERANIRFYEKEGLLTPVRRENGYRDYSDSDLELLLKIKLLRRLGFSLEEIKALQTGETAMEEAIARRLKGITAQRQHLDASEAVCLEMQKEGVRFATLDAKRYLSSYDRALSPAVKLAPTVPKSDRIQPEKIPWRRYFARSFDLFLTTMLLYGFLALVFKVFPVGLSSGVDLLIGFVCWGLLIPWEALSLSCLGTTPGKWLFGIRVEHSDGRKLTFSEAASRAWMVFYKGSGADVPIYAIYRYWKSYVALTDGEDLPWDHDCVITVKRKKLQPVGYVLAYGLVLFGSVSAMLFPLQPKNRGAALTVEQFVENYNQVARYAFGRDFNKMQQNGYYAERPDEPGVVTVVVDSSPGVEPVHLQFEEENGILTAVIVEREVPYHYTYMSGADAKAIQLSTIAFAWADVGMWEVVLGENEMEPFLSGYVDSFSKELWGCNLTYDWQLVYEDDTASNVHTYFSISRK